MKHFINSIINGLSAGILLIWDLLVILWQDGIVRVFRALNPMPLVRRIPARWLWSSVGVVTVLAIASALTFYILTPHLPKNVNLMTYKRVVGLKIVDWKDELVGTRGGFYGDTLSLEEVPWQLRAAFLVTEDKRFYDHGGIDYRGLFRALVINALEGGVRQGGSTITQQLAKNLFLSQDRKISRKLKEAVLAYEIEDRYSKDDILEIYLNRIYLGAGAYGVDAAARVYFGKSARAVTIAEAAMLAGLAKAPSRDAPTVNLERAQARSQIVLKLMVENNVISEMEYAQAQANPAVLSDRKFSRLVNYFLDYVQGEAEPLIFEALADAESDDIAQIGGTVIVSTSLDPRLQGLAEKAVTSSMDQYAEEQGADQSAMVVYSSNGALRAMVGGRSYVDSQFNRATQAMRQPGSAFKPFVYLAAIKSGIVSPDTIYMDQPVQFGRWSPTNYTGHYHGAVSVARALNLSLNTVAAQVAKDVGIDNVIATARAMGITSNLPRDLTLSLGSASVTPLELTQAYGPFASSGLKMPPYVIRKIETENGRILYERPDVEATRVFNTGVAKDMNYMMHQVLKTGTGSKADLGERPAAGKTGTSQDWRDGWFMGYTGDLVAGVWVGNDDNSPTNRITGGGLPALIWKDFMSQAHEGWAYAKLPGAELAPDAYLYAGLSADAKAMRGYFSTLSRKFSEVQRTSPKRKDKGLFDFDWW